MHGRNKVHYIDYITCNMSLQDAVQIRSEFLHFLEVVFCHPFAILALYIQAFAPSGNNQFYLLEATMLDQKLSKLLA